MKTGGKSGLALRSTFLALVGSAVLPGIGQAQADCGSWNTGEFFESASAADVDRCLCAGADLMARNENGETPLHLAASFGSTEVVIVLLKAGADLEARDDRGWTPLFHAGHAETSTVAALLDAGADLDVRGNNGWAPIHAMAAFGRTENLTAVLEAGSDIEARDHRGRTPLHHAAGYGSAEDVIALLNAGANAGARSHDGKLPVDFARFNKRLLGASGYCVSAGWNDFGANVIMVPQFWSHYDESMSWGFPAVSIHNDESADWYPREVGINFGKSTDWHFPDLSTCCAEDADNVKLAVWLLETLPVVTVFRSSDLPKIFEIAQDALPDCSVTIRF